MRSRGELGAMMTECETKLFQAARALGPKILECAGGIEKERQLPQQMAKAFAEAGLFKMLVPEDLGGSEASPETLIRVVEEVSRFDGNAGWCVGFGAVSNIAAAFLPEDVAHELFADEGACVASTAASAPHNDGRPPDRATVVDGGFRVSGRWSFTSGCMHATWLAGTVPIYMGDEPRKGPDGKPEIRFMYFPKAECQIIDTWNVTGLRGSGSHDFAVVDAFVPGERNLSLSHTLRPRYKNPTYAFSAGDAPPRASWKNTHIIGTLPITMSAICLGIARGAIDSYMEIINSKATQGEQSSQPQNNPMICDMVARAEAKLRSSRAYIYQTIQAAWEDVQHTGRSTREQLGLLGLASVQAVNQSADVVEAMWRAAGTSSIYVGNSLERRFRDINAATQNRVVRSDQYAWLGEMFFEGP